MHRGHSNEASGSAVSGGLLIAPGGDSLPPAKPLLVDKSLGRSGRGAATGCLLVALLMAALRTWVKAGLIPQARHGGSGVFALAVDGSKFDGTGLEKLQMVQTQVAMLAGEESIGAGLSGLSDRRTGEAVPFRGEAVRVAGELGW